MAGQTGDGRSDRRWQVRPEVAGHHIWRQVRLEISGQTVDGSESRRTVKRNKKGSRRATASSKRDPKRTAARMTRAAEVAGAAQEAAAAAATRANARVAVAAGMDGVGAHGHLRREVSQRHKPAAVIVVGIECEVKRIPQRAWPDRSDGSLCQPWDRYRESTRVHSPT